MIRDLYPYDYDCDPDNLDDDEESLEERPFIDASDFACPRCRRIFCVCYTDDDPYKDEPPF